ncbi:MAG: MBL fold metallo-hydrolase [Thermoguttaceae bacterium]|jgi:metallo-beta-lactamase family protein|nr:MBL fold metallo-hydrolase [Thermoguttaceae bacterium]
MQLQFLGAAGQVTGSCYRIETDGFRLLIDCGMYQERAYLDRNWEPAPGPPNRIDAVLLTHAHLDHSGRLPKLVKEGYRGPIYCTAPSADLVDLLLRDSAEIQAEDAAFKRKRHRKEGRKGKHPEVPLFTMEDVERTLKRLEPVPYAQPVRLADGLSATFFDAGHILGSAMIELRYGDGRRTEVVFSGDIGQWNRPIVRNPTTFSSADYVVMESTYGDRDHVNNGAVDDQIEAVINRTVERGGKVLMPVFAIERAQEIVYHLSRLRAAGRIPPVPVYLDSPMAADVTRVFAAHRDFFDVDAWKLILSGESPFGFHGLSIVHSVDESKRLNDLEGPAIIMAGSGMCTHGRIKHHLARWIGQAESTVLLTGYQAQGTLGRQILERREEVRIHGRMRLIRAEIVQLHGTSGHADRQGLLRWLRALKVPPKQLFLTHGDPEASEAFARTVREELGFEAIIPKYGQTVRL